MTTHNGQQNSETDANDQSAAVTGKRKQTRKPSGASNSETGAAGTQGRSAKATSPGKASGAAAEPKRPASRRKQAEATPPAVVSPVANDVAAFSFDRRLMEQQLAAVQRLLEEHDFESVDEANEFLAQLSASGQPLITTPSTPLEQAQEVVFQALRAEGAERIALAHRALEISPDCADAYTLLAELSTTPEEARGYYEQAVAAGERALGPRPFEEDVGMFWGLIKTRPYMRARQGLAEALWHLGDQQAAIEHARELLRLNPGDNQGIRYLLANWLMAVGDDTAVEALLAHYPDEWSAAWAYTRALLTFRTHGPGEQADEALERAMDVNPFVPMYLLKVLPFPDEEPEYYGMGDQNEAVAYLYGSVEAWAKSPGADEWMITAVVRILGPKVFGGGKRRSPAPRGAAKPRPSTKRSSKGNKSQRPKP